MQNGNIDKLLILDVTKQANMLKLLIPVFPSIIVVCHILYVKHVYTSPLYSKTGTQNTNFNLKEGKNTHTTEIIDAFGTQIQANQPVMTILCSILVCFHKSNNVLGYTQYVAPTTAVVNDGNVSLYTRILELY